MCNHMNWPSFTEESQLISQVMKLESAFSECEKLGSALSEELSSAQLCSSIGWPDENVHLITMTVQRIHRFERAC